MDISKAAAAMGRKGGAAGRGASKRRPLSSERAREIRAQRPKPQEYESRGEWSGYTVREGLKGWLVEQWSAVQGMRSGWRVVVAYAPAWPRTTILADLVGPQPGAATEAECIQRVAYAAVHRGAQAYESPIRGVCVLSRGHIVR